MWFACFFETRKVVLMIHLCVYREVLTILNAAMGFHCWVTTGGCGNHF